MVAYYDRVYLQTMSMVVEGNKVVDQNNQWLLQCPWEAGQRYAEGRTYVWNTMEGKYCQVVLVKQFLGHQFHANVSDTNGPQDQHQAEAIISTEVGEKIRIRPTGPTSQCGV